jgi:hypothetical protein
MWVLAALLWLWSGVCAVAVVWSEAYEVIEVQEGGSLVGEVKFIGSPPVPETVEVSKDQEVCGKTKKINEAVLVGENHGLQNVVVSIVDITRGKAFAESNASLDQNDCRYAPHVVITPVERPLTILNSDGILHSVHTWSEKNPAFHKAQSKFKKEMQETFLTPETIRVTCDVHSWMAGWIVVAEHPYVTVTDVVGKMQIQDIPPGEYELKLWHETLGERRLRVRVERGKATPVLVVFRQ